MKVLVCYSCKDQIVLTEELKQCSCGNVLGCLEKDNKIDVTGYSGALIDVDFNSIFELPEFDKRSIEGNILRLSPIFSVSYPKEEDTENDDEEENEEKEPILHLVERETSFGDLPRKLMEKNDSNKETIIMPSGTIKSAIENQRSHNWPI